MEMKRRVARGVAVIAIALGAGQLVQDMSQKAQPGAEQAAAAPMAEQPTNIERVAATDIPAAAPTGSDLAVPTLPAPHLPEVANRPQTTEPAPIAEAAPAIVTADPCPVTLNLSEAENAMIGVTLVSPCHASERVVVKHAGLTFTAQTTVTGALFVDFPALLPDANVEVMFKDNTSVAAQITVPELAQLRRFAVQWQASDAFQLHAFEDGSDFDGPGDISAANPHRPAAGVPADGGYMTLVGDAATDLPMLAQVYTYPAHSTVKPEIAVEAAVTIATCDREILGQTLQTNAGVVDISDISLTMPQCDAIGDYLVLKNLALDTNIASSN